MIGMIEEGNPCLDVAQQLQVVEREGSGIEPSVRMAGPSSALQ